MATSRSTSPVKDEVSLGNEAADVRQTELPTSEHSNAFPTASKTPEPIADHTGTVPPDASRQSSPSVPPPYDWDDFERRYEEALREADAHEREVLKEADNLSRYFRAWASAASAHDDERAVKRLQTRKRFVNLAEERMEQKQQHYEEVVKAFESALALLRST
ncbi:hypothetical protein ACRE_053870 [Hapsidospora chrysogenum ATCC 11550]|uniref:Uncharacterized protein n=1 Tax=Hapsidospora chrysogenum (strain ATCC 11550 / CBS 779.69 / DSM 880 / IAM 14645 / JCM 23072 / IMI 49137) TaxID=857340 RepID=A0A086T3A7_HAPC1|nr:hypothetical protein ACRE_053870 [Hapsidospora chrysogenum ATCC 11550]